MAACPLLDPAHLRPPGPRRLRRCQEQGTGPTEPRALSIVVLRSFRFSSLGTWKIRLRCAAERVHRSNKKRERLGFLSPWKLWNYKKMRVATASRNVATIGKSHPSQILRSRRTVSKLHHYSSRRKFTARAWGTRLLPLACLKNMMSFARKKWPGREE